MAPPGIVPRLNRGHSLSPLGEWLWVCPLGQHFDRIDSDEEDMLDAYMRGIALVGIR